VQAPVAERAPPFTFEVPAARISSRRLLIRIEPRQRRDAVDVGEAAAGFEIYGRNRFDFAVERILAKVSRALPAS
jgi:hypothetical protein